MNEPSMNKIDTFPDMSKLRFCFYGAGAMAEAIVRGMLNRGLTVPDNIGMLNRQNLSRLQELHAQYGVEIPASETDKPRMLREADLIILAMKPKDAEAAILGLGDIAAEGQIIVSLIAGLSIRTIEALLRKPLAIIRTMPNTSSTIGLGATGISFSVNVDETQRSMAAAIFQSVGITAIVEEKLIDAVTGVSGSGPAYIYYVMESMMQAGISLGLTAEAARALTVQTVLGAASMVLETGEQPAELRRKVTSPNGTTQAAIETLDAHQVSEALMRAVTRAAERAGELGADIERSALK